MKISITLDLPMLIECTDYHEIDEWRENLRMLNSDLKVKDLGCIGNYIGLVYYYRLPPAVEIKAQFVEEYGEDAWNERNK